MDLIDRFPAECEYVIRAFEVICGNDKAAVEQKMSAAERLAHHQAHIQPTMNELHAWLVEQIDGKRVEPNSALGEAINYMRKRWEQLTLFLRQAGAPLDNNLCERWLLAGCRDSKCGTVRQLHQLVVVVASAFLSKTGKPHPAPSAHQNKEA